MIGTVVGAAMIVVLIALFPQDRIGFLLLLAVWGGICAFAATARRNFASYSAALAGYTAAIIAADMLGATGGVGPDVFMLAVWRASEICIGIVCAGVVLRGDRSRRRPAAAFAASGSPIWRARSWADFRRHWRQRRRNFRTGKASDASWSVASSPSIR